MCGNPELHPDSASEHGRTQGILQWQAKPLNPKTLNP